MRPERVRRGAIPAALFLGGLLAANAVAPTLRLRPHEERSYPQSYWLDEFEPPQGPEFFFVHPATYELSQLILYHDLGESISNARKADILFIGNSRLQLGLRAEFLVPKAEAMGLRVFSIGCGHVERANFALDLIRKHDLRPKIVVATGGPALYNDWYSNVGEDALAMTRWDAMKKRLEVVGVWNLQQRIHAWLPKLDYLDRKLTDHWIMYRSAKTGWWEPGLEPRGAFPVRMGEESASYENALPIARELKAELDRRGTTLVLSIVPHGRTRVGHLSLLSEELGVPVVIPSFDEMFMADGSHLNRESAKRYVDRFWAKFVALPQVRARLSAGSNGTPWTEPSPAETPRPPTSVAAEVLVFRPLSRDCEVRDHDAGDLLGGIGHEPVRDSDRVAGLGCDVPDRRDLSIRGAVQPQPLLTRRNHPVLDAVTLGPLARGHRRPDPR